MFPSPLSRPPLHSSLLSLYRRLLRAHATSLPPPLRALGDATAKSEWKAMAAAAARAEGEQGKPPDRGAWELFATSWARYVDTLNASPSGSARIATSGELTPEQIEALSPDQRARLRRMAAAAGELAKGVGKKGSE